MRTVAIAIALNACGGATADIPRPQACQQQADAWCTTLGAATTSGCGIVYRHWCGMTGEVPADEQEACLDAILEMRPDPLTGYWVPAACDATWATPGSP